MSDEIQSATPAEQVAAEQVQSDASTSTESSTEQTQEQTTAQEQTPEQKDAEQKKQPWFQKRIDELTREKFEARRAAEEAYRRAQEIEQRYSQPQQGQQSEQGNERALTQADIDRLADQRASQKLAERSFNEACNKVYEVGAKEFSDFDAANRNLQMMGANTQFYELATSSDAGHKVIHHLGSNLDEADRILRLPPVHMARELTKLEFKLNQPPAPKPVSKAPAPIKPIGSSATADIDPSKVNDNEWYERVYLKNRK